MNVLSFVNGDLHSLNLHSQDNSLLAVELGSGPLSQEGMEETITRRLRGDRGSCPAGLLLAPALV